MEWDHLLKAMRFFGFPDKLINWIKYFYTNIETCIINNGNTTKMFKPSRGVRQGCSLSPYLFVITVELLSLWIRQNPDIKGITSKQGDDYTISQFANDTSVAIENNQRNIKTTFNMLQQYGEESGLRLNINKTEILPFGKMKKEDIP